MRYEIDILYFIDIYKKEYKRMVFLIVAVIFITGIMGSVQPVTYRSTLIALSPQESGKLSLGGALGLPNLAVGPSSTDLIFSMLRSRRMSKDINEHFNLSSRRKFWWGLDAFIVTGGFAVEVKGSDPELTMEIANFAVENLDKINLELQVSSQKSMVKVLDPALRGSPMAKNISNKAIASGLGTFLVYTLLIFFKEYFKGIKKKAFKKG